jgi:hypothetical protein
MSFENGLWGKIESRNKRAGDWSTGCEEDESEAKVKLDWFISSPSLLFEKEHRMLTDAYPFARDVNFPLSFSFSRHQRSALSVRMTGSTSNQKKTVMKYHYCCPEWGRQITFPEKKADHFQWLSVQNGWPVLGINSWADERRRRTRADKERGRTTWGLRRQSCLSLSSLTSCPSLCQSLLSSLMPIAQHGARETLLYSHRMRKSSHQWSCHLCCELHHYSSHRCIPRSSSPAVDMKNDTKSGSQGTRRRGVRQRTRPRFSFGCQKTRRVLNWSILFLLLLCFFVPEIASFFPFAACVYVCDTIEMYPPHTSLNRLLLRFGARKSSCIFFLFTACVQGFNTITAGYKQSMVTCSKRRGKRSSGQMRRMRSLTGRRGIKLKSKLCRLSSHKQWRMRTTRGRGLIPTTTACCCRMSVCMYPLFLIWKTDECLWEGIEMFPIFRLNCKEKKNEAEEE